MNRLICLTGFQLSERQRENNEELQRLITKKSARTEKWDLRDGKREQRRRAESTPATKRRITQFRPTNYQVARNRVMDRALSLNDAKQNAIWGQSELPKRETIREI